jgi:hypothetical protein
MRITMREAVCFHTMSQYANPVLVLRLQAWIPRAGSLVSDGRSPFYWLDAGHSVLQSDRMTVSLHTHIRL